jgi:protein SCO1/2
MTMRKVYVGLLGLALLGGLVLWLAASRGRTATATPVLAELPEFALLDQSGRRFDRSSLLGRTHVVNFFFTSCPTSCPLLTRKMREIVQRMPAGERIGFVSFSVDPERDTPERLRAFAESYQADFARWSFVTGPGDALYDVVVKGFRVGMGPKPVVGAPPDIYDISHGEQFVVVDARARLRAFLPARDESDLDRIVATARRVADEADGDAAR